MTDTERELAARRIVLSIAGQAISANDPKVEQCGFCGRRIEVCTADRRIPERCDEAPSGYMSRPKML